MLICCLGNGGARQKEFGIERVIKLDELQRKGEKEGGQDQGIFRDEKEMTLK